jgi:hypothetical protein
MVLGLLWRLPMTFWTATRAVFAVLLGTAAVLAFNYPHNGPALSLQKAGRPAVDRSSVRAPNPPAPDQFCAMLENTVERAKRKLLDEALKRDLTNLADVCAGVISADMEPD